MKKVQMVSLQEREQGMKDLFSSVCSFAQRMNGEITPVKLLDKSRVSVYGSKPRKARSTSFTNQCSR